MSGIEEHYGVQVVKVKDDHTYKLDEAALKQILLREDVKNLPVVLVSVAGAYRGGKSFLLDLFLKYLNAPESERDSKMWLGDGNEPLGGFRWRVGCDRETTGMHLWSDPIKVTYNGEKVVVLLMDTQGTFDSNSSVRDCSTIFALSTLLSSVQIYNLKENIKEDDLQNLHLFAEYGKLAQEQETTPFQVLTFLVRDWPYKHQHPYGAVGGMQLLDKRLEITAHHTEDMRNLRTCIRSFFQSVTAFLMPHPGFTVNEPEFDGRLSVIREEFKQSLLELVTSILSSQSLVPKTINGQRVKCCDLFYYFKTYMSIFNSNKLPEPVSIMQATSEAALMSAEREARDAYAGVMGERCGPHAPCLPADELRYAHQLALQAASDAFGAKRKMGSQKDIDECLAKTMQDLESQLAAYETLNDAKLQNVIANSHKAYDDTIQEMCGDQVLCLHPDDLDVLHMKAKAKAFEVFDMLRTSSNPYSDEERSALAEKLESEFKNLRNKNDQNNRGFVTKAHEHYVMYIANATEGGTFLSEQHLRRQHTEAKKRAMQLFHSYRNMESCEVEDSYIEMLEKNIKEQHSKNILVNKQANKTAMQAAQHTYTNYMTSKWSPHVYCLHPKDLLKLHSEATSTALEEFMSNRGSNDDDEDVEKNNLIENLEKQYKESKNLNNTSNDRAIEEAYNHYCRKMESNCKPSLLTILVVPWVIKVLKQFPEFHESAKSEAISMFRSRRRQYGSYNSDEYYDRLVDKLNQGYDDYCHPLRALAREFGLPL